METGKSRLYLPEDGGRRGGEGEHDREKGGYSRQEDLQLSTADEGRWVQNHLASAVAVISIPSYSRYNENCVWKQCHLQRQSGKKLWSGPVQLHGSQTNCVKDVMSGQLQQSRPSVRPVYGVCQCYFVLIYFFYKVNKSPSTKYFHHFWYVQSSTRYEWKCDPHIETISASHHSLSSQHFGLQTWSNNMLGEPVLFEHPTLKQVLQLIYILCSHNAS